MVMLLLRSARAIARPRARMMSTLLEKVQSDISLIKASSAEATVVYPLADFKADMDAGTVDSGKLSEAMAFSPDAHKLMTKMMMEMKMSKVESKPPINFDAWSEKIQTTSALDALKKIYEDEMNSTATAAEAEAQLAQLDAIAKENFHGPDGLYALASKEEKAMQAEMQMCLDELELLEKQIQGVGERTIAEILEMEPELRKEIEAELDASKWAP